MPPIVTRARRWREARNYQVPRTQPWTVHPQSATHLCDESVARVVTPTALRVLILPNTGPDQEPIQPGRISRAHFTARLDDVRLLEEQWFLFLILQRFLESGRSAFYFKIQTALRMHTPFKNKSRIPPQKKE